MLHSMGIMRESHDGKQNECDYQWRGGRDEHVADMAEQRSFRNGWG